MNILMMALMYPEDQLAEVTRNAKDKVQNQINSYQRAFVQGIDANLEEGERLDILNSLPVGIYPLQYRKLILKKGVHDQGRIRQMGCINLPWMKQRIRRWTAECELEAWVKASPENRVVLSYTQYLPYMKAILAVKKRHPDLKAAVIVTDLPNEMGLASGRKGLLKQMEKRMGESSLNACRQMDGFVLLTEPMADALNVRSKPFIVLEGLITQQEALPVGIPAEKPAVLYTGTLEPDLGITEMLEAFASMPEYELWICGMGSMSAAVTAAANAHSNIKYFGFVPQKEALAMQAKASALINPRSPNGLFTRYSFPSKTLEYMRSGKPVICYQLEGIPSDYDPYLFYIPADGAAGIQASVKRLMALSPEKRAEMGARVRSYVLQHKNPAVQCKRLLALLRSL